jgi:hypothetical protein
LTLSPPQASPEYKLPALYLLDSVAKNLRPVYAALFERNLAEVYVRTLESASPSGRTSLEHLRATWKALFPSVRTRRPPGAAPVAFWRAVLFAWMRSLAAAPARAWGALSREPSSPASTRERCLQRTGCAGVALRVRAQRKQLSVSYRQPSDTHLSVSLGLRSH